MYREVGLEHISKSREIGKPQAHHASRTQGLKRRASAEEYITGPAAAASALSEATFEVDGREGRKDQDEKGGLHV